MTTLQQIDKGMDVCPFAKDRDVSAKVMRSGPRYEDNADRILVAGDEDDSPSNAVRNIRKAREASLMACYI